jgi:hypothetical protein
MVNCQNSFFQMRTYAELSHERLLMKISLYATETTISNGF